MKTKTVKTVCTLALCAFVAAGLSARPHHHRGGGSKDLYRAAAIVDIVTNSLVGLSVLAGNAPVVAAPAPVVVAPPAPVVVAPPAPVVVAPPAPVVVAPAPTTYVVPAPPPPPVYVVPSRRHVRPAPPPRPPRGPAHHRGGGRGRR